MNTILKQLRDDHVTYHRLLERLEAEISIFEQAGRPNYELIDMILSYFLDYPEIQHHPLEDLLYQKLTKRVPNLVNELDSLIEEHTKLGLLTRGFAKSINDVLLEEETARGDVAFLARKFLNDYRKHIDTEEKQILPLADKELKSKDWAEITIHLADNRARNIGPAKDKKYRQLREMMNEICL